MISTYRRDVSALTPGLVNKLRFQYAKKYKSPHAPSLVHLIAAVPKKYKKVFVPVLKRKPVRSASGVAIVAVCWAVFLFL